MCSSPKSSASSKAKQAFAGSIMSGLDQAARQRFAERANIAADKRVIRMKNSQKTAKKVGNLLSYFHLALIKQ